MQDYYEVGPVLHLPRPVVVASPLTELTRKVAHRTSALLGVTFQDVDRRVEHEAGKHVAALVEDDCEGAYRRIEAACLARAVRERPAGIVALSDGGLILEESRELVASQTDLVVLHLDLPNLFWRIQHLTLQQRAASWSPEFVQLPRRPDDLRPFYSQRRKTMAGAVQRIDANGRKTSEIVNRLIDWLRERADHDAKRMTLA
jgi:shikimate kinase